MLSLQLAVFFYKITTRGAFRQAIRKYSFFKVLLGGRFPLGQTSYCPMRSAEKAKLDRRPCLTGGAKRLSICYSGREPTGKNFLPVRKSPFTNPCKSPLFCMRKVNISLFLMENLQNWGFMGDVRINSGFYWGSTTGICCAILEGEGVAAVGVRAADWPRSAPQEVTLPRPKFE